MNVHRSIRTISLIVFAGAIGLLVHRLRRTPEQQDLTRYVEVQTPRLRSAEQPVFDALDRLAQAPGLPPDRARALLVDDLIPRLLRLRKQANEIPMQTGEVRALHKEYLAATDQLLDACRTSVQVIDDPKLSTQEGVRRVHRQFGAARAAYRSWEDQVRKSAARHHLSPSERSGIVGESGKESVH